MSIATEIDTKLSGNPKITSSALRSVLHSLLDGNAHVTPEAFWSAEDGDDWAPAIERAQDAGSVIALQPGKTYEISRAIANVSNRTWRLNQATIYNPQTHGSPPKRSGFLLGNVHPAMFSYSQQGTGGYLPCHDLDPVAAGAVTVALADPTARDGYSVGQFVVVRHVSEISQSGGQFPLYAQFNKVRQIDANGTIHLSDPVHEAIAVACLSPFGDTVDPFMGEPWALVENVVIEGGKVDGRSITGTRTGAYNCRLENLLGGENAALLLAVNAFVGCNVENVRGNVTGRLLEVKCYSQNSRFSRVRGVVTGPGNFSGIEIGEQSNRLVLDQCGATMASSVVNNCFALWCNGWLNSIRDCELVNVSSYEGAAVAGFPDNHFAGYGPKGNRLQGGRLTANGNQTHHLVIGSPGSEALEHQDGYIIDGVDMAGATSLQKSIRVGSGGMGGRVVNCTLPHPIEVSGGAVSPAVFGNV